MHKVTLVASLSALPSPAGGELENLPEEVEWLETRSDLIGDPDPDWLRERFSGRLLYSLRSREQGGAFQGSDAERHDRLLRAANRYDLIELEAPRDLVPCLLDVIPENHRLISWHGETGCPGDLSKRYVELRAWNARLYRLTTNATNISDGIGVLEFLKSIDRQDVIAFACGLPGLMSRLMAPRFGATFVYGMAGPEWGDDGTPPIARLIDDYGMPALPLVEVLCGIVGNPVSHSLSPRLHNAAYRMLDFPGLFLALQVELFDQFWRDVVDNNRLEALGVSFRGLTVASPHKEQALNQAKNTSRMVRRAAATNIIVRNGQGWKADTTDPDGVVEAIRERAINLNNKKAAVIGCGGAGRAVAAALQEAGAEVVLVNRGSERGRRAVELLELPFVPLSDFSVNGVSLLVNATPVGRDDNQLPFDLSGLDDDAIVVDLVYGENQTPLVKKALALTGTAIDGREVLMIQVSRQFKLMTGYEMPRSVFEQVLGCEYADADLAVAS